MEAPGRERISFTREQFYEQLWSVPTTKFAKELGCSDVMVGKVCKAFNIPKPYLGYWAKLDHGKAPKKTPLPTSDNPELQILTFEKWPEREVADAKPTREYDTDIRELLDRARSLPPVEVLSSLSSPHPLVVAARTRIKIDRIPFWKQTPAQQQTRGPTLAIEVGEDAATRALCIMDSLIKRVEKIGGRIEIKKERGQEWKTNTVVCFSGEDVSAIRIREKHKRVRVPPEKKESSFDSDTKLDPSGVLLIDTGPSWSNAVLISDTPQHHLIEDGLNDLVIGFVKKAGEIRIRRREEEEARIRHEEAERIRRQQEEILRQKREVLAKQQKAEQARVDELLRHADAWKRARMIRDYLGAVCDLLLERNGTIGIHSEAADYLRWALQQADRIDPLKPTPPSVLDQRIE
jgi:hypothetical protein